MVTNTPRKGGVAFASATLISAADELLGKLAALRPIETKTVDTKIGVSEATIAQVVEIGDDGQPSDLGERPIFWQVVRRQLAAATADVPWIAGRLSQSGPAYRLDPLTDAETALVGAALDTLATG